MVNIKKIFDTYNIQYREYGKNVKKGNINICCPFCGNDEGFHLGIEPSSKRWGCWKNISHRGRGYKYLLAKTLNLPSHIILQLCEETTTPTADEFDKLAIKLFKKNEKSVSEKTLDFPKEFKEIIIKKTNRFTNYLLNKRKFDLPQIESIIQHYKLKSCLLGDYEHRIIIPVYVKGKLVTWTGRDIRDLCELRYLTLSEKNSIIKINDTIFDYDNIKQGGSYLFICEGPFDVIKLFSLSDQWNKATCIYTKNITEQQILLLSNIAPLYKKLAILLDKGENLQSFHLISHMDHIKNLSIVPFPFTDIKDPGEFTQNHYNKFIRMLE